MWVSAGSFIKIKDRECPGRVRNDGKKKKQECNQGKTLRRRTPPLSEMKEKVGTGEKRINRNRRLSRADLTSGKKKTKQRNPIPGSRVSKRWTKGRKSKDPFWFNKETPWRE